MQRKAAFDRRRVLAILKAHGLLLETDVRFPNVCALVVGEPVRGSWWAHPRSHDIFHVNCALADNPEVLVAKLISGKVTFIDRDLWPEILAIGGAREPWQTARLSPEARQLLARVEQAPVATDRALARAASELEKLLLVASQQFHTASGSHARRLESWDHWRRRTGLRGRQKSADEARRKLEAVVESLNEKFHARGRLPWQ